MDRWKENNIKNHNDNQSIPENRNPSERIQNDDQITPDGENRTELEAKALEEYEEKYQRLAADFRNYKKRVEAERAGLREIFEEKMIKSILSIYDDFDRLYNHVHQDENLVQGVQVLQKKWLRWLESNEVELMNPEGQKFDHRLHDAVLHQPVNDLQLDEKIVQVIENGYLRRNKVLRYAKVAVGRYEDPNNGGAK